jgi:serine/threonine-protein kinase
MGTVYLAATRGPAGFEKLKVIKRLHSGMLDDAQSLNMFLEEARVAARLNHPNIVQTNAVGFDGHDYFIEMEYFDGQPLDAVLRRAAKSGGVPVPLAMCVLTQVLAGLGYAHELKDHGGRRLGLVHRDVSPHNVFVTYDGVVKLLDFGIAKASDSSSETRTGMVKGKATYMAPEQATRGLLDARADLFAVGVIMWEALTRRRLWEGLQDGEIFQRLAAGEIQPPRAVEPSVDERLDAICAKALAPKPQDRWHSATEMASAVEDWLEGCRQRFGQRALAKWVSEAFAERRAATQAEVDAQLDAMRQGVEERRGMHVPVLGASAAHRHARTAEAKPAALAESPGDATGSAAPESPPRVGMREARRLGDVEPTRTGSAQMRTPRPRPRPRGWLYAATGVAVAVALAVAVAVAAVVRWVGRSRHESASLSGTRSAAPSRQCTRNAECPREAICRVADGICVALKSEECRWILGDPADIANDSTEWIGVMIPNGEQAAREYRSHVGACELARRDFAEIAGGLPPAKPGGPTRPLAMLVCDDSGDADRAVRHLTEDVRVPAVVGFRDGQEALRVIANELLPKGVLAMVALNTNALITQVPQPEGAPRLVWRTTYSNADTAVPLSAFVADAIEPRLRAHGVPAREALRVGVLHHSGSTGLAFADRLFSVLRFNGKPALANGSSYLDVIDSGDARAVDQLLAFAPHVVVHTGSDDFPTRIFAPLEERWPPRAALRPTYVAGSELGSAAVAFARSRPDLRARFFGLTTESTTDANAKFVMRYNALFPDNAVSRTAAPNTTYDAVYALAYSVVATGRSHPTGLDLVRAIPSLTAQADAGAEVIDVGPARIFEALRALGRGHAIDLRGTAGSLDWDAKTGEVRFAYAVLCVTAAGEEGTIESGMTFDSNVKQLRGQLSCE